MNNLEKLFEKLDRISEKITEIEKRIIPIEVILMSKFNKPERKERKGKDNGI